jgi:hypothetical protein
MRFFSFKRWRVRELLLSWIVYWVVLIAVRFGPAALAMWRATRVPSSETGNISVNVGNKAISLIVSVNGRATYSGSIHPIALALLVAGPPLVAWIAWAATRRRGEEVREVV